MSIRRELSKRRQAARSARSTEQGVAGHKAAMAALGRASVKDPNIMRGTVPYTTDEKGKTTHYIDSNPSQY